MIKARKKVCCKEGQRKLYPTKPPIEMKAKYQRQREWLPVDLLYEKD
jgi:hypothetical protein